LVRNLKAIAAICKIDKPLTSHIARHSFAVNWLTNGGSMEVLSKVLGHADMKITQLYGKIINRKIDDEIDLVFE
jgi:site-specific recombinase XerD